MNQKGLSIIDFAIGSAIVLVTAGIILPQFMKVSKSTYASSENIFCLNAAENLMSQVITHKPMQIRNFSVASNALSGKVLSLYPTQNSYSIDWIFPDLATSWSPVEYKNGKNIINGVFLQTGAIARAINFYNYGIDNNKDICTNYISLTEAIELLPNQITEKQNLLASIQKQKSNLADSKYSLKVSKAIGSSAKDAFLTQCQRPFIPAPITYQPVKMEDDPALSITLPEIASEKAGFLISLKHSYKNKDGNSTSCEVSRYIASHIDSAVTNPEPDVTINFSPGRDQPGEFKATDEFNLKLPNKQGFSARNSCRVDRPSHGDNPSFTPLRQDRMESDWDEPLKVVKIKVKIAFDHNSPGEAGSIFLCRDQSVQYNKNYCGIKNSETPDPRTQPWVPCEVATLCGVPVDGSKLYAQSLVAGQSQIELLFTMDSNTQVFDAKKNTLVSSPQAFIGCDLRMDIATVDIAGNSYAMSNSKRASYHSDLESQRAHIFQMFYQPVDCWNCKIYKFRSLFSRLVRGLLGVALYVANLYTGGAVGTIVSVVQSVAAPVAVGLPPLEQTVNIAPATEVAPFVPDSRIEKLKAAISESKKLSELYDPNICTTQEINNLCRISGLHEGKKNLNNTVQSLKDTNLPNIEPEIKIINFKSEEELFLNQPIRSVDIQGQYRIPSRTVSNDETVTYLNPADLQIEKDNYNQLIKELEEALKAIEKREALRKELIQTVQQGPSESDQLTITKNIENKRLWLESCLNANVSESECLKFYDTSQARWKAYDDYQDCMKIKDYYIECPRPEGPDPIPRFDYFSAAQAAVYDQYNECILNANYDYTKCPEPPGPIAIDMTAQPVQLKKIPSEVPTWVENVQKSAKYLNTLADVYNLRMAYLSGDSRRVTVSLVVLGLANKVVQEMIEQTTFKAVLDSVKTNYNNVKSDIAKPIAENLTAGFQANEEWKKIIEDSSNAFAASLVNSTLKGLLYGKLDAGQVVKDAVKASAHTAVSAVVDKALSAAVNDMLIQAGVLQNAVPMSGFLNVSLINTFGGFGHGPGKLVKETKNCTDETQTWKTGRWFNRRKWTKRCERAPIRSPAWVKTAGIPACEYSAKLHYAFPYQHMNFVAGYTLPGETFEAPVHFDANQSVVCQAKFICTGDAATKISYFSSQPPKDNDADALDYEARSTNHCDAIMTRVKYIFSYEGGVLTYKEAANDNRCRMNQPYEDVYDQVGNQSVLKKIDQQMPYPSAAQYASLYQACDKYGPLNSNPIYEQVNGYIIQTYISSNANEVQYRSATCPSGLSCKINYIGSGDYGTYDSYDYIVTKKITRDVSNFHLCQPVMNNGVPVAINFPTDINANLPKIGREFYVLEHRKPYNKTIPDCFNNERSYQYQIAEEPGLNIRARHELNLEKEMMAEAANICGEINKANAIVDLNDPNLANLSNEQKQYAAQFKLGFESVTFPGFSSNFPRMDHLVGWAKNRGNYQLNRTDYNQPAPPYCSGYQDIDIGTINNEFGEPKAEVSARCYQCQYSLPSSNAGGFDGGG